jgi:cyclophilin family peptidyl-prolyl cis-trans isomerase
MFQVMHRGPIPYKLSLVTTERKNGATKMMIKKTACLIIALVALLLAACGGGGAYNEDDFWAGAPAPAFACSPDGSEPDQFEAPEKVIHQDMGYIATITMEKGGQIVIDLYPQYAPITVNNFVFLACQGFYNGLTFHRVVPDFVAQGGDPTGIGTGGPGYTIADEADNGVPFDRAGLLSMAHRTAPHTSGSQFFITYRPAPELDQDFTVFGTVTEGMDVVSSLTPRDPQDSSAPPGDAIASIRVEEVPAQ